jgi:NADP-dependent 3-hydroxy acid dehydrogenase YdfG
MTHVLVIGGSGMLAEAVEWLISEGNHVSVVGRTEQKMEKLLKYESVTPVYVDYHDNALLEEAVQSAAKQDEIDMVIAWIHSSAEGALHKVMAVVAEHTKKVQIFHVLGSSAHPEAVKNKMMVPQNCEYYQIQLGSVMEKGQHRWLTHEEISNGIIEAVKSQEKMFIVGKNDGLG